jgi:hypothetical protein
MINWHLAQRMMLQNVLSKRAVRTGFSKIVSTKSCVFVPCRQCIMQSCDAVRREYDIIIQKHQPRRLSLLHCCISSARNCRYSMRVVWTWRTNDSVNEQIDAAQSTDGFRNRRRQWTGIACQDSKINGGGGAQFSKRTSAFNSHVGEWQVVLYRSRSRQK